MLAQNGQSTPINYQTLLKNQLNFANIFTQPFIFPQFNVQTPVKQQNTSNNPICLDDDEPRKCHSSTCTNPGDRKAKNKKNEVLYFCERCLKKFNKGNYCDFCQQVYSSGQDEQDESHWIMCDNCEKWVLLQIMQNHINCEQKYRNKQIKVEIDQNPYYCLQCTKPVKKVMVQQQQAEKLKEYKPNIIDVFMEGRNKEKNITFVATKDNKIQFSNEYHQLKAFRLNLYEEEIKTDLDYLRNADIPQTPQPKITKKLPSEEKVQSNDLSDHPKLRTRNQNKKVNYRDLGGEY